MQVSSRKKNTRKKSERASDSWNEWAARSRALVAARLAALGLPNLVKVGRQEPSLPGALEPVTIGWPPATAKQNGRPTHERTRELIYVLAGEAFVKPSYDADRRIANKYFAGVPREKRLARLRSFRNANKAKIEAMVEELKKAALH
jgi:hypothetical protein